MSARANPVPPWSVRQQTMKAARVHRYGPPDVIAIEGIDLPTPGEGEFLARVHAAGVGPWDALVRAGNGRMPRTLPLTLGSEVSGVVERVGPGTTGFAVGDDVFSATNPMFVGGYAECAFADASMIVQKPAGLSHEEAASMPLVAVTAWQMLFDRARVRGHRHQLARIQRQKVGRFRQARRRGDRHGRGQDARRAVHAGQAGRHHRVMRRQARCTASRALWRAGSLFHR
jgi:Alcohol dehydrogenase GroES-like domain